jgi:transcriptional regulator with XRE-family HTH domain
MGGLAWAAPVGKTVTREEEIRWALELGRQIGVALQQIQKYEVGKNRVSASRLTEIAAALGVPLVMLFDVGSLRAIGDQQSLYGLLDKHYSARLLQAFELVRSESQRIAILSLIEAIGASRRRRH